MKKIVFIMATTMLILSTMTTACKTQNKASKNADSNSTETSASNADLLTGKHWKLIELFGNPVTAEESNNKEPYIIFEKEENRFSGDAGCNRITGSFQTKEPNRITFSQVVATKMMCLSIETENKFLEVINKTDSYIVRNDTLVLNRARMATLARFVAVSME